MIYLYWLMLCNINKNDNKVFLVCKKLNIFFLNFNKFEKKYILYYWVF